MPFSSSTTGRGSNGESRHDHDTRAGTRTSRRPYTPTRTGPFVRQPLGRLEFANLTHDANAMRTATYGDGKYAGPSRAELRSAWSRVQWSLTTGGRRVYALLRSQVGFLTSHAEELLRAYFEERNVDIHAGTRDRPSMVWGNAEVEGFMDWYIGAVEGGRWSEVNADGVHVLSNNEAEYVDLDSMMILAPASVSHEDVELMSREAGLL